MSRAKFKKILDRDQDELDKIQAVLIMVELDIKKEIEKEAQITTSDEALSKMHVIFSRYENMVAAESYERRKKDAKKEKRRAQADRKGSDDKSDGAAVRGNKDDASEGTA